jgi:hypothetical protein
LRAESPEGVPVSGRHRPKCNWADRAFLARWRGTGPNAGRCLAQARREGSLSRHPSEPQFPRLQNGCNSVPCRCGNMIGTTGISLNNYFICFPKQPHSMVRR